VLGPLPESYADTAAALHRLTVYVISPAQRLSNGAIALRTTPGGFGTFPFGEEGCVVRIDGADLVVDEAGDEVGRTRIGSLADAARALGIEPDVGQEQQFDVPPAGDVHAPLAVDPAAVVALHAWFAFTDDVLEVLRAEAIPEEDVSPVRIWPEHFDSAIQLGDPAAGRRATYGGSPGDRHHPAPYLYASPWAGRIDPFFADSSFRGAALTYDRLVDAEDQRREALAFLRHARDLTNRA
jgi:hypothetical protein